MDIQPTVWMCWNKHVRELSYEWVASRRGASTTQSDWRRCCLVMINFLCNADAFLIVWVCCLNKNKLKIRQEIGHYFLLSEVNLILLACVNSKLILLKLSYLLIFNNLQNIALFEAFITIFDCVFCTSIILKTNFLWS